jgi:hypothetical protein
MPARINDVARKMSIVLPRYNTALHLSETLVYVAAQAECDAIQTWR